MRPLQLNFYKGSGAVQFNLQKPHYYCPRCKKKNFQGWDQPQECQLNKHPKMISREGAIFIDITSSVGRNEYDWTTKVQMALSIHEIGKLMLVLGGVQKSIDLFHDPGAKTDSAGKITKKLQISSPDGVTAKGVLLRVSQFVKGEDKATTHSVGLSPDEVKTLHYTLIGALPVMLAWS
jgi:hypothetical protein